MYTIMIELKWKGEKYKKIVYEVIFKINIPNIHELAKIIWFNFYNYLFL